MCGIVGIFDIRLNGRADPARVRSMALAITHRGPDGDGFFQWPLEQSHSGANLAMGMRRLSIIDLNTGDQPIFNEDRTIALVFNGEIYNYVELREQLEKLGHTFYTHTDSETLVHGYEAWGLDLFDHLRGMYAFALWDAPNERLLLAVDHVGIKPLYFAEADGQLFFASEAKALFVAKQVSCRLNLEALDTYLTFGYMIGGDTLYDGVQRLPPGHALVIERGTQQLLRHWNTDYPDTMDRLRNPDDAVRETRERLQESVRLHLRRDVPLGLFLSGGVDSASLLALMTQMEPGQVQTFSVGYDVGQGAANPDDETQHARRIATHFGAQHHERIIGPGDWWQTLLAYVYHHDEPNANPSIISLQALAQDTAQHVKVVLNGTGGDELFAGYRFHRISPRLMRNARRLDRLVPRSLRATLIGQPLGFLERYYPTLRRYPIVGALPAFLPELRVLFLPEHEGLRRVAAFEGLVHSDALRRTLYGPDLRRAWQNERHAETEYTKLLRRAWTDDPADFAHALMIHTWLPGNGLLALDKVTMAHSLEARVPFFDPPLLAHAMRIAPDLRLRANKFALREAMRADLPDFALQRPKQPFGTPILRWFDGALRDQVRSVLLDERSLGRGLFNRNALEGVLQAHFSGETDRVQIIFRLLLLELWHQATIDAPPHIPHVEVPSIAVVEVS